MPKTLLLADDSVTIQKVVGISLASEDISLVTVDNGDDALTRAREIRPDAILADCVMPGRSGYEVAEAIAGDPALRHIPVLLLTGTFEAFDEERAARCGAAGHIAKPFEAQTLLDEVQRLFALAASRRASASPARPARPAASEPSRAAAFERPRPVAAPPPRPVPAPAPPESFAESFDFFDEDLDDLMPAALAEEPELAREHEVDLDSSESSFAFGSGSSGPGATPAPLASRRAAEHTVAILTDAPAEDELDAEASLIGEADLARLDADATPPLPEPLDGRTQLVVEGLLDFGASASARMGRDDSPLRVDGGDLAGATVLDPQGAGSFDVSASDLGDPFAVDEPQPAPRRAARPEPAAPAVREPEGFEPEEFESAGFDSEGLDAGGLELLEAEPEPPPQPDFPEDRGLVFAPEPEPEPEPLLARHAVEPPRPAFEAPSRRAPLAREQEVEALAQSAVEAVAPRLRSELHDALEKVAWESFGDVTDQIVRLAVERIEAIAWEVIPQMAETLIREEIRRLKGDEG